MASRAFPRLGLLGKNRIERPVEEAGVTHAVSGVETGIDGLDVVHHLRGVTVSNQLHGGQPAESCQRF